jgi:hypothetical protein
MLNEITKNIPIYTIREFETINRFKTYDICSEILIEFFNMGFKNYRALEGIMEYYHPDIDKVQLKRFWNCVGMDEVIVEKVKDVFQKLKSE